ncbi:MAG: endo-1,4-beta-xylanase [Prevotella sp.]|jgi:endo-1,4-beta-xylanase|nr:endo-1,4-beta-xylanase [Prevotella sp.]MCI1281910.1 endo-1,4-beta-xylanase [Prevotella sp.]
MKHLDKLIPMVLGLALLASCADNDALGYSVSQPDSTANLNYLKQYDVLKSYVDRTTNPNFKLGTGVSVSEFEAQGMPYRLASTNFDELTPRSEMTHGAVVETDGSLDTTMVAKFLSSAQSAEMSVYGHTLCWHSAQNGIYLNKQLEPTAIITGAGDLASAYCFKATNGKLVNPWECQAIFNFPSPPAVTPGKTYELEFMVKGSVEGTVPVSTFSDWNGSDFNSAINVTTSWNKVTTTNVMKDGITALKSLIFHLGHFVGTIYIDDLKFYEVDSKGNVINKNLNTDNWNFNDAAVTASSWIKFGWSSGTFTEYGVSKAGEGYEAGITYVDKTDAEKKAIVDGELERWIKGMMGTCKSYIHAWDIVSEPMDDADPTQLKTGKNIEKQPDDAFYWQDYLGKDYAVKAITYARKYGNSDDKLFISDYGLEAKDDKKLDGLLNYVKYVESKGVTVDGISTEMNLEMDTVNIDAITNMFKKLAATGKLIRITQLDLGIGSGILTGNVTDAQYRAQADMYQAIIKAYFDNVPAAQRYGITLWYPLDQITGSSWHSGEPIGLWTQSYDRKRAYGSFANGLAGKELFSSDK